MIGTDGEKESKEYMLSARFDDDDNFSAVEIGWLVGWLVGFVVYQPL